MKRTYKKCEKCGLEITTQNYEKHIKSCTGKVSNRILFNRDIHYCKYCNSSEYFKLHKDYKNHLKVCKVYQTLPKDSLGRVKSNEVSKIKDTKARDNFKCNFCGRFLMNSRGRKTHEKYCPKNPNKIASKSAHNCSDENRLHQALLARQRFEKTGQRSNFNHKACEYIDQLNLKNNWKLQHALNGGEIQIGPYFLDGYDKINNIAFEYNERAHYTSEEKITHDRKRAEYIVKQLHCSFYVFNEEMKTLEKWY